MRYLRRAYLLLLRKRRVEPIAPGAGVGGGSGGETPAYVPTYYFLGF